MEASYLHDDRARSRRQPLAVSDGPWRSHSPASARSAASAGMIFRDRVVTALRSAVRYTHVPTGDERAHRSAAPCRAICSATTRVVAEKSPGLQFGCNNDRHPLRNAILWVLGLRDPEPREMRRSNKAIAPRSLPRANRCRLRRGRAEIPRFLPDEFGRLAAQHPLRAPKVRFELVERRLHLLSLAIQGAEFCRRRAGRVQYGGDEPISRRSGQHVGQRDFNDALSGALCGGRQSGQDRQACPVKG